MSFTVNEKTLIGLNGTAPILLLTGTATATAVSGGTIAPGHNTANISGSDRLRKILAYSPSSNSAGSSATTITLYDIQGSANTDSATTDAAAAATNSAVVAADSTVTAGAWTVGAITNPALVRNVFIEIENPTLGTLNLYVGAMTFTITGTDYAGAAQTETIVFTSTSGNKAVATTKFRHKYGSKPFKTVTGVTLDNVPDDGFVISVGIGSKISLLNRLKTPAESDVLWASMNLTTYSVTGKVDTTNYSINFGTLSDGDNVSATFLVTAGGGASATKSYDSSNDADILTVACEVGETFDWWIIGLDAGA
jgi:hypothetical protein